MNEYDAKKIPGLLDTRALTVTGMLAEHFNPRREPCP